MNISGNGISEQITTLREQLAATEAEIEYRRLQLKAQPDIHDPRADAELAELVEARGFMTNRLNRLESCQHGFEA